MGKNIIKEIYGIDEKKKKNSFNFGGIWEDIFFPIFFFLLILRGFLPFMSTFKDSKKYSY